MAALDAARSALAELRGEVAGEVRIAAFPSAAAALVPRAVHALRAAHPKLEPILVELEPVEALSALGSWQADIAIVDDLTFATGAHPRILRSTIAHDALFALLPSRRVASGVTKVATRRSRRCWPN